MKKADKILEDLPPDEDAEAEWAKEINSRIAALKTGRAKTVGAEEALSPIEARLRRKK